MFFPDNNPDISIMQQMLSISNFECQEHRDILSIALNTCGIPLSFRDSLKAKEDIFWIFSLLVLASGELGPLVTEGSKLKLLDECRKREIVSWVDRPSAASLDEKLPILSPNSISSAEKEFIELDLLVFTQIPANVSQASMEKALTIIGKYHLLTHAVELGAMDDDLTKQGMEIANLAPNAELIEEWRYPSDLVPPAVTRIKAFLRAHTPSEELVRV